MSERRTRIIPIKELIFESCSEELVHSENMKPYTDLLKAEMAGLDTTNALAVLAALPLEQRYVWRVVSALKWGLCDLETENVAADLATLQEEDLKSVTKTLALRAMQFSLFTQALVGKSAATEIVLRALVSQGE